MSQLANDTQIAPIVDNSLSSDDIFKALSEGDESESLDLTKPLKSKETPPEDKKVETKPSEEEEETEETEEEEEIDELAQLEEELADPTDEQLEAAAPVSRREILKQFPDLFKKIPYLEKAYYREQQYTKVFANPADAIEAANNNEMNSNFVEDVIVKGNAKNYLKLIKDTNSETFNNVVDNMLDSLAEVDKDAYLHVTGGVIKSAIVSLVQAARESGDDDFRIAAELLNQHVFGTKKFIPHKKLAKEPAEGDKKKEDSISQREKEFNQRQLDTANNEITSFIDSRINTAIAKLIDPNEAMTAYVKRNATRDAFDKIKNLISKDTRLAKLVDNLKSKMVDSNYSKESKDNVKRAYLARANALLAPVIKSARNEALRGMGKRVKNDIEDTDTNTNKEKPERQKTTERRLSSDKSKASLDSVKGLSTHEALNKLLGDD